MATAMGLGVGLEGGVCNSCIRSATSSSGHVCTVSIRAGGVGVLSSNARLSSSARSLTTSPTTVLTNTSLDAGEVAAGRVLGEQGSFGSAGSSSSRVGSDGPGWSGLEGVSVVASFPQPIKLRISPEIFGRFSTAMGGTSGCSSSKRTHISILI